MRCRDCNEFAFLGESPRNWADLVLLAAVWLAPLASLLLQSWAPILLAPVLVALWTLFVYAIAPAHPYDNDKAKLNFRRPPFASGGE